MADLLSIGASASQIYKSALSTVSNNIANLTTEGYSRQSINISENAPDRLGQTYLGTGATVDTITRGFNAFAENNLRQSKGELSTQDQLINYASQVVDVLGSDSAGLNQAMDRFFAAAGDLSIDPASTTLRSAFLNEAEGLAIRFNELAGYLNDVEQDTQFDIDAKTVRLNNLAQQLVAINAELEGNFDLKNQPPALLDQRDRTLLEMAEIANIHVTEGKSGAVNVRLDNAFGTMVVDNNRANQFSTQFNQPQVGSVEIISSYGVLGNVTDLTGGALGGLLSVRSQVLLPTITKLDDLANTLTSEVNAIQTSGYDGDGINVGTAMFGDDGVTTGAAGLTLLINDPKDIAAAQQANSPGDNSNMVLLSRLQTKDVMTDGGSLTDGYNSIVTSVGSQVTLAKISREALQVVYDQAVAENDQVSGVNLDEEAADLIRYQQAFQASAKIIEVSSKLFDAILAVR
jgi:flagellar hook-associated protein 1 FlgK